MGFSGVISDAFCAGLRFEEKVTASPGMIVLKFNNSKRVMVAGAKVLLMMKQNPLPCFFRLPGTTNLRKTNSGMAICITPVLRVQVSFVCRCVTTEWQPTRWQYHQPGRLTMWA
ncbi:MAG: hypothetical protein ACD_34C00508G0002 [uncultured bacterium]|nr:MAG: hypothetical protein ACD_34C00508G0002 [uncultured bacterium]